MELAGRLALIADTHLYRAGLPWFFDFLARIEIRRLACLGDCEPEPFRRWLKLHPEHELYWTYDIHWPEMPEATANGLALKLGDRVFLAHTRATAVITYQREITAYKSQPPSGRPPLLICHGHTHTPSVTRFGPRFHQVLYTNSVPRLYKARSRRQLLALEPDTVYLIVPGSFTLEEGRFPSFNFALVDLDRHRVEMFTLAEIQELATLTSALAA